MSRREAVIKATAAALQPKALDLTKYRQRSARDSTIAVKAEDAAGALAFAALDREDGPGDTLRPLLLRLKYAQQRARPLFIRCLMLLLERHGYDPRKPSEVFYAVGLVALFEWLNDACPRCRSPKPKGPRVTPCPACRAVERENVTARFTTRELERDGRVIQKPVAVQEAAAGCPRCKGMGRIFTEDKRPRGGMRCVTCQNTGRQRYRMKQRWQLVSEFLGDAQAARREQRRGIDYAVFRDRWEPAYVRLVDYLRRCDRSIVEGLDLRVEASNMRDTEPERLDPIEETAEDEPGERRKAPGLDPEKPRGLVPPQES